MTTATPDFTCECPLYEGETRALYRVTGHDGAEDVCEYCIDCADLARIDWNGETASIEAIR